MKIILPLIHLDNLVFTPLPQLLLKQQLVLDGVCAPEDVVILEYSREDDIAAIFSDIVSHKPDGIGWSCYVWNFRVVEQVSRAIKDYDNKITVVWGGPHVSEKPRWFAQHYKDSVDFVTAWYGEINFSQLCKTIASGSIDQDKIPAFTVGSDGVPGKAPEFDEIPLPYKREWLPDTMTRDIGSRVFLYETYRNCPFSCLSGRTLVNTAYGMVPIKQLAEIGGEILVYTFDESQGRVLLAPARNMRVTQPLITGLIEVTAEGQPTIRCTKDHKFKVVSDGEIYSVEAGNLQPGNSLISLTPGVDDNQFTISGWSTTKIKSVVPVASMEDVYCLEVPATGWFFANNLLVKNCEYCLWGKASNKIEGISFEQTMAGFDHLLSLGMKHMKFADAGLGVVKKDNRDKRIFRALADMDLHKQKVHLRTYFFWQVVDDEWAEIFAKLISQGVIGTMDLGIQSFNPKAINDMKRPTDYDRFHRVVGILQKHRVPYSIDLILGLPGDTLDGFKRSVSKCIEYKPQRFQSFLCSVLPGAGYDLRREDLGIKTIRGSLMDDDEKVIETMTFPREDMQIALNLEAWLYIVFSLQLCPTAIRKIARDCNLGELAAVESLRSWSGKKAPHLCEMVSCYRKNLYDSRQKGRVQCDEYLYSHFVEIFKELGEFAFVSDAVDEMYDDLLRFPKSRMVAEQLVKKDWGLEWDTMGGGMRINWKEHPNIWYEHRADPIPGVVATKYAFWTWDKVEITEEVLV